MRNNSTQLRARGGRPVRLSLTAVERAALLEHVRHLGSHGKSGRRAQVVLLSDQGLTGGEIGQRLGLSAGQVSRIRSRFRRQRLGGLTDRPRSGRGNRIPAHVEAELVAARAGWRPGGPGSGVGELAVRFGLSRSVIYKILRRSAHRGAVSPPDDPAP